MFSCPTHRPKKPVRCCYALIVFVVLATVDLLAQADWQVERISTENGLSQGAIFDILQDRDGFLWIATKDGLNRYDGYNFKVFTNDPDDPWSISGNSLDLLFEDSAGRIWACSGNSGINIYDKQSGRFHHIKHDPDNPSSISDNRITYIVEDTSGMFILGVNEAEINMFALDAEFFQSGTAPRVTRMSLPPQKKSHIYLRTILKGLVKDAKGRVWVGGEDVIYRLDVERAKLVLVHEGSSIGSSYANPDGTLWASGFRQPLFLWDGTRGWMISKDIYSVIDIQIDSRENMWLLRPDSLYGFNLGGWIPGMQVDMDLQRSFFRWQPETPAGAWPLRTMILDRSGIIWVGTLGNGLYKINAQRDIFAPALRGISVRQIAVVSDGEYYVRSYPGVWYDQDGNVVGEYPPGVYLNDQITDNMLLSRSGEYWIRQPSVDSGEFKLYRYHPDTRSAVNYTIGWQHYDTQPMIECRDGSIWMAGFNDVLTKIDPASGKVISYDLQNGRTIDAASGDQQLLSRDISTALYEDSDGTLWVGTERGMTKCIRPAAGTDTPLNITTFQNIPGDQTSLSYNHVMCFLDDPLAPGRYLWICTKGGGINRMDKATGSCLRLTTEDGLPDNVVYGMMADDDNNIWGSTNKGIFCLTIDTLQSGYQFRNFSQADGLQSDEFNTGAYARLPNGKLMFGGINGLNIFDPEEVLSEDYEPNVFLTSIAINNKPVLPGDESGILTNTIETTRSITLTHLQDIITLEFASLDLRAPDRNKYRYQLVGADDSWVESGSHRSATFLHLRPGSYTFRVEGSNSRGIWSEQMAELDIDVLPPWWRTWWAYAAYIVLIGTAIWGFMLFRINRSRLQQQLEFEQREAEHVREMDAMKTRLFMNMTHEFRTPLSIILGMARQVLDDPKENFREGMDMIVRNGQNLLGLVNKMLNLSKLESGKLTLDLVQGDVVSFLRNLVESFRSFAAHKRIQLHFLPEVNEVVMDYDPDKLQQVISNLVSNAFKFTPEQGNIYFSVRRDADTLVIRVKDTGRGIPDTDQEKIFERFYQVDDSMTRQYEGTGIGLALTSELIKLMHGDIHVVSPPVGSRVGSEFIVRLPIQTEAQPGTTTQMPAAGTTVIEQDEAPAQTAAAELVASRPVPANGNDNLILLVEDNTDVVAYVASCLFDYQLVVAENGKEGLEMAIELTPDLIISDVMMPVMDGFALCRKLKSDERTDHIPVVMLTARADLDSKLEGLEFGANAYLAKPFAKQELLLTLKNLFDLRANLHRHYQVGAGLAEGKKAGDDIPAEDAFVTKVQEIITTHIDDFELTVERLAGELHLSHSQFGRKLNALTGFSPNQFIRMLRLKQAKELLTQTDLSVTAIAFDCGFNDPAYFSRVFKKEFKQTPVEWRSSLQEERS